jgi:hypothetical protein
MSNFHKLLNRAYREIITEQDQPPIAEEQPQVQPDQAAPTPIPEIPEQEPTKNETFSPENKVFLVRLLPKALMIDTLDTQEQQMLADIGDIDEVNANEVLEKIVPIINKYAPSSEKLPKV